MKRGGVYWLELEDWGRRPVCVLTRDEAIGVMSSVVVALVTRTIREIPSEVPLGPSDGMRHECVISLDNLRTVPRVLLMEEITQLGGAKLEALCWALEASTGC